jgi:hypothetical protein
MHLSLRVDVCKDSEQMASAERRSDTTMLDDRLLYIKFAELVIITSTISP